MDTLKIAVQRPAFLLILALFPTAAPTGICRAGDGVPRSGYGHGRFFDGSTLCRWHRTWHGPNANWTPLSPYYIPRPTDTCKYGGHRADCYSDGCAAAAGGSYFSENAAEYEGGNLFGYAESAEIPVGLERLGQIPNDLGISGGTAAPPRR